jgi:hypothetical protein
MFLDTPIVTFLQLGRAGCGYFFAAESSRHSPLMRFSKG